MLSGIWERVKSTVTAGVGWVGDTWAMKSLAAAGRTILDPVADVLGEPVAEYLSMLGDAVDAIVTLALTPMRKAWAPLGAVFSSLMAQLSDVASAIYDGLRNVVRVHIPRVYRWAGGRLGALQSTLLGIISSLRRWAGARISDLWREISGLRRWVIDRVVVPLIEAAASLRRWAGARIADLSRELSGLRQWVIDRVLVPLWDRVNGLIRFVYGRVLTVVRLVEAVWVTLQAIARYGPGHLFQLLLPGGAGRLAKELMRYTQGSAVEALEALDETTDKLLRL